MQRIRSTWRTLTAPLGCAAVLVALAPAAEARQEYSAKIPNGTVKSCANCHVNPDGGGRRNDFGLDVAAHKTGRGRSATIHWSELWFLDSDGDGQTNGQELGDPCGEWSPGRTPQRLNDISNPGNPDDTSANPGEACEPPTQDTGPGGQDAGPGNGDGDADDIDDDTDDIDDDTYDIDDDPPGCFGNQVRATKAPGALALLSLLGLLGLTRRRS